MNIKTNTIPLPKGTRVDLSNFHSMSTAFLSDDVQNELKKVRFNRKHVMVCDDMGILSIFVNQDGGEYFLCVYY